MSSILIAEDHAEISSFIDKGLRAAGYQTEVVGDGFDLGARALSAMRREFGGHHEVAAPDHPEDPS